MFHPLLKTAQETHCNCKETKAKLTAFFSLAAVPRRYVIQMAELWLNFE